MNLKGLLFALSALFFMGPGEAFGQAPKISYTTPQVYHVSQTISPLTPNNTGGPMPANAPGVVTAFAGSGVDGTRDGTGKNAQFFLPAGIYVEANGDIMVADYGSGAIRTITPDAVVKTVYKVEGTGPSGLTGDHNGNIYFADFQPGYIYKSIAGGRWTVFAGYTTGLPGQLPMGHPCGFKVDAAGNFYVACQEENLIRKISPSGVISPFVGGSPGIKDGIGADARFYNPDDVAIDKQGNIFIADTKTNRIRKATPEGVVTTFAGNGKAVPVDGVGLSASFNYPTGLVFDIGGNLYVAQTKGNVINRITPSGVVTTIAGSGKTGSADGTGAEASFNQPVFLATDGANNLYVSDEYNDLIRKIVLTFYAIDKDLPPGLSFDSTTGIISGMPTAASPATNYTVTAYNKDGNSSTVVNITVDATAPLPPPVTSYQTPQTYKVLNAISPLSPLNTGGAVPATFYGQVNTIAGSTNAGSADGVGAAAGFNSPAGIAIDATGNTYIADNGNSLIRKILPDGTVTTFAGNASQGHTDGVGTAATFNAPIGVAVDGAGNVYIADEGNNMIRKITPGGVVTTLAGSGTAGSGNGAGSAATFNRPYGVAADAVGNVYVADEGNNVIRKITPDGIVTTFAGSGASGSADGAGTAASFFDPEGIAIDAAGNLYIGDVARHKIRKITPAGLVSTIAGTGLGGTADGMGTVASFESPSGLTVDAVGNIYIADTTSNNLRKIAPDGTVTTLAGHHNTPGNQDGVGQAAGFRSPQGVAVDAQRNLIVTDGLNNEIRKVITTGYTIDKPLTAGLTFDPKTGTISGTPTVAYPATTYTIAAYNAGGSSTTTVNITVQDRDLAAAPNISYQTPNTYKPGQPIPPLAPSNAGGPVPPNTYAQVTTFAGSGIMGNLNGNGVQARFKGPVGLTFDGAGNLYVSELVSGNVIAGDVRKIAPNGDVFTFAGDAGLGPAPFVNLPLYTPGQLTFDSWGNLLIADGANEMIEEVTADGAGAIFDGNGYKATVDGPVGFASFDEPYGLAADPLGNVYVTDRGDSRLRKINAAGNASSTELDGGAAPTFTSGLGFIAVDAAGNQYFADGNRVKVMSASGIVTVVAGSGTNGKADGQGISASFMGTTGIALDRAGNIYVGDTGNDLIRKITPAGLVSTLAGSGARGASDGIGPLASFYVPGGLALDNDGNFLYVADGGNNIIRKIALTGYTIDKPLPAGLNFDPKTGIITGTPTSLSPATNYTITAYNGGGSSTTTVNISVSDAPVLLPPNISYQMPQTYHKGSQIPALVPNNTGGAVPPNVYGEVSTFAGPNNGLQSPAGVAIDAAGNIYIGDDAASKILKISPGGVVSTFAGGTLPGSTDGIGTAAGFDHPHGVAVDAAGNVYVADQGNNLVRKITPDGTVSTLAGSGTHGAADGTGTAASFNNPFGVAVDAAGNVYVADEGNNLIRKITPGGVVTTFAGNGTIGGTDGSATAASFNYPQGIAIDAAGNIYVSDSDNNKVRKITPAGLVSTIAGSGAIGAGDGQGGAATFYNPYGLAVNPGGFIYVVDQANNEIRQISPRGLVSTLAGNAMGSGSANGIGPAASFNLPGGIAIDALGNLMVADGYNNEIRKVIATGYTIDRPLPAGLVFDPKTGTISGTPTVTIGPTIYTITAYNAGGSGSTIVSITIVDQGVVSAPSISYQTPQNYAAGQPISPLVPTNTGGVVPQNRYGEVTTFAGSGAIGSLNGNGVQAKFKAPVGVTFDGVGNLFVSEEGNRDIRKITPTGDVSTFAAEPGSGPGPFVPFSFYTPDQLAFDHFGNLLVADYANSMIEEITTTGTGVIFAGSGYKGTVDGQRNNAGFDGPYGIVTDVSGNVYVTDRGDSRLRKIDAAGNTTSMELDGGAAPTTTTGFGFTALDASRNQYFGDGNQVKVLSAGGVISVVAGSGTDGKADGPGRAASFDGITGIAIDRIGNVYVGDSGNNLIRKITPQGFVSTLAGSGAANANDGVGPLAGFYQPKGVTVDNQGNFLYVADALNNTIRKVAITGYAIDKPLPAGLTFDATTGTITGTPTATSSSNSYTITAYNNAGSSSAIVSITVSDNSTLQPPHITYTQPPVYHVNQQIATLAPQNTGGPIPPNSYGQVFTFAGNATAGNVNATGQQAQFNIPMGLVFDAGGNLFVSEQGNNDIREVTTPAAIVSTYASATGPISVSLSYPSQLTFDKVGDLLIADEGDMVIKKISSGGVVTTFAGNGYPASTDGTTTTASFDSPYGLTTDAGGNIYDTDRADGKLRKIDGAGNVTTIGVFDNPATSDPTKGLDFMATDAAGNIYFGDDNQVKKQTPGGTVSVIAGSSTPGNVNGTGASASFSGITGVALDAVGNIYVGDSFNNLVRKVTPTGVVTTLAGSGGGGSNDGTGPSASFHAPAGLAVDNNDDFLYVADSKNNEIRKIAISGYSIDKSLPTGLYFDPQTGVITGTPAVTLPATVYTITAYNAAGSSSYQITIEVDAATINFPPIPVKTVCDAGSDFDPGATSGTPLTYTSSDPSVATIIAGKVHIIGPGTSVITASDGTTTATQTLTVDPAVVPAITVSPDAGNSYCQGSTLTYNATQTGGGAGPAYQWQVNGVNIGGNSPAFTSSSLNNNDQVTCTLTSNATCVTTPTAVSNTIAVTISQPESTSISIISTLGGPVCPGTQITFTATPNSPGNQLTYQWQVNGKDVGSDNPVFTGSDFANGDVVTCNLISTGPCIANSLASSAQITVSLIPRSECVITIPSAFTPNGDGVNDLWDITALQGYPDCVVTVFNRYGAEVYRSVGYSKAWNGTYSGSALPSGTYYYIIDLGSGKKKLSGAVTIIR